MDKTKSTPVKSIQKKFSRKIRGNSLSNSDQELSKDDFINLLSISRVIRTKAENRLIAEYISFHIDFFRKLRDSGEMMLNYKLADSLNYESYQKDINIINYGEEGDKFYILIDGVVAIYKPIYVLKQMRLNDYMEYMSNLRYKQNNKLKYTRINDKNYDQGVDVEFLKLNHDPNVLSKECMLYVEDEEKLVEFPEPFSFGEIALIKKCNRNATIKTIKDSKFITINKNDYNKVIREFEEKRLENQIKEFQKIYPLFQYWSQSHIIGLFNCFSRQVLSKGEYLYKQNEDADSFYIIKSGTFEMYSLLSFGWLNEFFDYIVSAKTNIIFLFNAFKKENYSDKKSSIKESDIVSYYSNITKQLKDSSPPFFDSSKTIKINSLLNRQSNDIDSIRKDQDEANNPNKVFKILARKICSKEVVGIEDSFEVKKRFCSVKCVSQYGEVDKVNLLDFLKIMLIVNDRKNNSYFSHIVAQRKTLLFSQLKNGAILQNKKFNNEIIYRFDTIPPFKPSEETRLNLIKIADKQLFDYKINKKEAVSSSHSDAKDYFGVEKIRQSYSIKNENASFAIKGIETRLDQNRNRNSIKGRKRDRRDNNSIICSIRDFTIVKRSSSQLICPNKRPLTSNTCVFKKTIRLKSCQESLSSLVNDKEKEMINNDVFLTRNRHLNGNNKSKRKRFDSIDAITADKSSKRQSIIEYMKNSHNHNNNSKDKKKARGTSSGMTRNIKRMLISYNYNSLYQHLESQNKKK